MMLGAQGVWMGTRFIASVEAYAHFNYKHRILEIDEEGTTITRCHSGKPCRLIRNNFTDSWVGREAEILPFPLQSAKVGFKAAEIARYEGKIDDGGLACGQTAGLIDSIKTTAGIVREVMEEADLILRERVYGAATAAHVSSTPSAATRTASRP